MRTVIISTLFLLAASLTSAAPFIPKVWCEKGNPSSQTANSVTYNYIPALQVGKSIVKSLYACRQACFANPMCRCGLLSLQASTYYGGYTCTLLKAACSYAPLDIRIKTSAPNFAAVASCRTTVAPYTGPARCWGGPGGYPWQNPYAKVGVTRVYQDPVTNSRVHCICTANYNSKPAAWKCSTTGNDFSVDYGATQFKSANSQFQFKLSPPYKGDPNQVAIGSRIHFWFAARSAIFCSDIKTPAPTNGSVFSMYMTSGEPKDRTVDKWDELDFELLSRDNNDVWLNTWHNGQQLAGEAGFHKLPFESNLGFHTFCIDWTVGDKATWIVNGYPFHTHSTVGWTKQMIPTMSFWGQTGPLPENIGLANWVGMTKYPTPPYPLYAYAQNIAYEIRG